MPILTALPPPDPGFEISIATRGVSKGISQTDGIQIIPRAFVRIGGAQIGGQWKNINSPTANGVAAVFGKFSRPLGKVQLEAGAAYRIRTGSREPINEAWEFNGGLRGSFGRTAWRLNAEYAPNEFGKGRAFYAELGPAFELDRATRLSVNIGRREREQGPDYTMFNAGISRAFQRRLSLDARYHMTNRSELGTAYRPRIVVSARVSL